MEQITDYFCGPAAAAMILKALKVPPPSGVHTNADWQNHLWEQIKQITTGPKRPGDAKDCPGYMEEFEKQQCFRCDDCFLCWAAVPQALSALMNLHLPVKQHVAVERCGAVPDPLLEALVHSVDAGVPAILGKGDETHWVVINGYRVGQPGQMVGGKSIRGFYLQDPADGYGPPTGYRPIDEFIACLGFVGCGPSSDRNKMVALVRH